MKKVEKWGVFEVELSGKSDGNPFVDYNISATFTGANERITVNGFYDGDGVYKVRFMPSFEGHYTYEVSGSFGEVAKGEFDVTPAGKDNHGPMRVAYGYHFAYEDGTPYYSIGTTCYAWVNQSEELQEQTLKTLSESAFNKIRFCVFPKFYLHNLKEPVSYPYVDGNGEGLADTLYPPSFPPCPEYPAKKFNYFRFNTEHFKRFDKRIKQLRDMNIEADLIILHPYDKWGFSNMNKQANELYFKYIVARFAAFRNIWWSFANEYDLLKNMTVQDWEHMAEIICAEDPYGHLRSIHNCGPMYDHSKPWITHCSCQRTDFYKTTEFTDEFRTRYGKPVVWDEICYEGNINMGWGNISAEELVRRFWEGAMRGGYVGHGETYENPDDILWWSHGGVLHGESEPRLRFLHKILTETPGKGFLKKSDHCMFDEVACELDGYIGSPDEVYEIHYLGLTRPSSRTIFASPNESFDVDVIDTWNMTVTNVGIHHGMDEIPMPGHEYMAIRLRSKR